MNALPSTPTALALSSQDVPARSLLALTEAAAAINSTLELDVVLNAIARLAAQVSHADASSLLLLQKRDTRFVVAAAAGSRREALLKREFDTDQGIPGLVFKTGRPIAIINAPAHARFSKQVDDIGHFPARSIIAAPLVHRGQTLGVIEVVNRLDGTDFSDVHLNLLQVFATLAAGAVQNARAYGELKQKFEGLQRSVARDTVIIGDSPQIREALELATRVATSNATVLILGETGTGKELLARYIHQQSRRRHATLAAVNCAAFAESLLESELFGHEKGAFTGAHAQKAGWFEIAAGGTLFLDEVGEVGRSMQAKLLRVLQEREFVRVGGTQTLPSDVRIVAATNRDLKAMMAEGKLREDLYYRLNVFPIRMPSLRERRSDIPALADHFVRASLRAEGRDEQLEIAPRALEVLQAHEWPGNIRELQNVIEWSVLMADGNALLPEHLPPHLSQGPAVAKPSQACSVAAPVEANPPAEPAGLFEHERSLILKVMNEQDWNQSRAARVLGVSRDHLRHRLKKYNLHRPASSA